MKRSQTSKSAGAKKAKQSAPQQSSVASAATGTDWCSDCWALAQDACRGAHRLVDFVEAQKNVAAEMSDVQREVDQALLKVDQVQLRMNALSDAVLRSAPVLKVHVPAVDSTCWDINGGTVCITLASTEPLTAEDIKALCRALDGLDLEYHQGGGLPHARVDMGGLEAVMKKLPDFAKGQKCEEGDLLLDAKGHLIVAEKDAASPGGSKLLGRMGKKGVDNLCAATCGEDSDCEYSGDHDEIGEGTTFENVRLVG